MTITTQVSRPPVPARSPFAEPVRQPQSEVVQNQDTVEMTSTSSEQETNVGRLLVTAGAAVGVVGLTTALAFSGQGFASGVAGAIVGAAGGGIIAGVGTSKLLGGPTGAGTGIGNGLMTILAGLAGAAGGGVAGAICAPLFGTPTAGWAAGSLAALGTGIAIYSAEARRA